MNSTLSTTNDIQVEVRGNVGVILLDRSEHKNAMTPEMIIELWDQMVILDEQENVRAIVIGAVGSVFSAGYALKPGVSFKGSPVGYRHRPGSLRTPIIGALNGAAVGVGLTLALQWDVRFVAEDAKYGFVFAKRGLFPEMGCAWLLPRLVGASRASDLLLSGRFFSGRDAVEWGMADAALPADQVLDAAIEYAEKIATENSPLMVGVTKRLLRKMLEVETLTEALDVEKGVYEWMQASSQDKSEGIAAFLEKRQPEWPDKKREAIPEVLSNEYDLARD